MGGTVLEVQEALAQIEANIPLMPSEVVPLASAYGRFLAHDIRSSVDVPPWDNSAMDGYAIRAADTASGEVSLRLLEMVGAGAVSRFEVLPQTAIGIMTGAPMPGGADAVVMVEQTDGAREGTVRISGVVSPGAHVRRRGEDVCVGQTVLRAGTRLNPAAVGMLSALGLTEVAVRRRPVVAILSTGDEVVPAGTPLKPGQIWSSNNSSLVGAVAEAGAVPLDRGIVSDDKQATVSALRAAVGEADVVLTTGGVSVGVYDVVKEAYAEIGAEIGFWKVNMKPGKPLAFGHAVSLGRRVPLFGLPGNPVSCLVNFYQFVRPWLRRCMGDARPYLPVIDAILASDVDESGPRARFVRVILEKTDRGIVARLTGSQSSGVLGSMAAAGGLLLIPPSVPPPRAGERVRVQLLDARALDGESPGYGW